MEKTIKTQNNKACRKLAAIRRMITVAAITIMSTFGLTGVVAFADDDKVTINENVDMGNADGLMGNVLGILLTITRYVGVALVVYGVYEIVMSFMQNQPEAKTKGIIMALAGIVMIALKSILVGVGVVQ